MIEKTVSWTVLFGNRSTVWDARILVCLEKGDHVGIVPTGVRV
jgi:hypothetical protein